MVTKADWLSNLQMTGTPVIVGQHLEYNPWDYALGYQRYFAPLQATYNRQPLMPGLTLGLGATAAQGQAALAYLKERGFSLVCFDHHALNPWTGGSPWDTRQADLVNLASNAAWRAEVAKLQAIFLYAQSLGITGIWRPFHEANSNGSFWWDWGCAGQQVAPFKNAWHALYQDLRAAGVNNLLWCYSLLNMGWTDIYLEMAPAAEEFDLVGLDLYSDTATLSPQGYAVLQSLGKPIGLTEVGPEKGYTDALLWLATCQRYPALRFIQFWHSWDICHAALVSMANAGRLLHDAGMQTLGSAPAEPSPVATLNATVKRELWWWKIALTWSCQQATGAVLNGKSVPLVGSQTRRVARGTYTYVLTANRGELITSATVDVVAK